MLFRRGPGVGGHCLPIDPSFLSWRVERQLGVCPASSTANDINRHMPGYVVREYSWVSTVGIKPYQRRAGPQLGLAYKANDARDCLPTASKASSSPAREPVHDDHVGAQSSHDGRPGSADPGIVSSDAAVLVTDHDDVDYDRRAPR
jgi:UDP-N-acetyl-D-glucosamine dehydrogenase